jgi:large subunit ribosomal protein L33
LVERVHGKDEVIGSIPILGSSRIYESNSMSQDQMISLECTVCKHVNYNSRKNKKLITNRLVMEKFCKWCKKHTEHKETKK